MVRAVHAIWNNATHVEICALIYQRAVETSSDLGVKIILHQSPREIHEMFISGLYSSERVLINVMADNSPLNNTPLFIYGLVCLTRRLYNVQVRNMAAGSCSELGTDAKTRIK